jgi:hypothetical protein
LRLDVKKQDATLQLDDLMSCSNEWQTHNLHIYLPEKSPSGKGALYIGTNNKGLLGGMCKKEERGGAAIQGKLVPSQVHRAM